MHKVSDKLTDLDFALLRILPDVGAKHGNHTFAKQVKVIVEELGDATSGQVQGRLRSMAFHGLTANVVVQPVSMGKGWQRTEEGRKVLESRRAGVEPLERIVDLEVDDLQVDDSYQRPAQQEAEHASA